MPFPVKPANRTKQLLCEGKIAFGAYLTMSSPRMVELCALGGVDFIIVDMEHHPYDDERVEDIVRAAELCGVTPIVRLLDSNPRAIGRYLDWGFQGIIAPGVQSAEEAESIVQAAKFAPQGTRGLDLSRGSGYGKGMTLGRYAETVNDDILTIIMIEHIEVLPELEKIVAVPGIDLIDIGPTDLSTSMGYPGQPRHPEVDAVAKKIIDASIARGLGLAGSIYKKQDAEELIGLGYRMLFCSTLTGLIVDAVQNLRDAADSSFDAATNG